MGWTYYDVGTLPEPNDIVWCKWPQREDKGRPGRIVRPTLVREVFVRTDSQTGEAFGSLIISYATGNLSGDHERDLVVASMERARELGLHKPTRFSLDPSDRKHLLWCEEYFVSPDYVRRQGLVLGSLGEQEIGLLRQCLIKRGLIKS